MNRQQGWTLWTLLLTLAVIVFFSLLLMKLWPHYLDNFKIQSALETVSNDAKIGSMTKNQIVKELDNILYIDFGDEIVDLNSALTLDKSRSSMALMIDYEVVVHLVWNISALLEFNNRADAIF